ncbi:GNAT family N-acetyltransferase [Endozoicomonas arenosclerae]|uniref:GNAT family N-acetyltransferase n=1 Tax=Endozoicomonas arenosclerae TaxID=1633495 RepID=UPI0007845536|nr:GNAT family N-acetyltransferase [Endozoicomonas arenosclerae]
MKKRPEVITLKEEDTVAMFDWVRQQGWNPGLQDASTFYKAAHGHGALLGIKQGDRLAGVSGVFNHSHRFAYFGLYIVHPDFREKGLGFEMTRHRLHLAGHRNIALDGVIEQCPTYRRTGFRAAHQSFRFCFKKSLKPSGAKLTALKDITLIELLDYEQQGLFPCRRKAYLKAWLTQKDAIGYCSLKDQTIQGYGVMRPCIEGFKIGPLFADTPDIAKEILLTLLSETQGAPAFCDIPEPNEQGVKLFQSLGDKTDFETIRMYNGYEPEMDYARIFGLTSLEAG